MPRTLLLTLGRLPKALDLARAFHADGWRVVVAEPLRWHLTGVSRAVARSLTVPAPAGDPAGYRRALAEITRAEAADLVLPVSEEAMHAAALADDPELGPRVFSPPAARVRALHDKLEFNRIAAAAGLDVPASAPLGSAEAAAILDAGDAVAKPRLSCGGRGVEVVRRRGAPAPRDEPALVQAFVRGEEVSTFGVARDGRLLLNAVYRGRMRSGSVAVSFERIDAPAVDAWAARFAAATAHTGLLSFDFVVGADGRPRAIECNPRATSGLHFVRPEALVAAILGDRPVPPDPFRPERRMQQAYPCLTETQAAMLRRDGTFRAKLRELVSAKDVTWSAADPLPFLTMTLTSATILWRAARTGLTLGEAATADIAYAAAEPAAPALTPADPAPAP